MFYLIQVLTLVVRIGTAAAFGSGRLVSGLLWSGVLHDDGCGGSQHKWCGGGGAPAPRWFSTAQSGLVCVWASWGPLLSFLVCRFSPL